MHLLTALGLAGYGFLLGVLFADAMRSRRVHRVTPLPPLDPERVRQMCREMAATDGLLPRNEPYLFVEGDSDKAVIQSVIDLSRRL